MGAKSRFKHKVRPSPCISFDTMDDGTELIEAYGESRCRRSGSRLNIVLDYLFKFIVIGTTRLLPKYIKTHITQERRERESRAYSTNASIKHVSRQGVRGAVQTDTIGPVKEHSSHTIGVEFSSRTLRIGDRNIKLQVGE
jgi:hypothetical protein